ncbi:hypothetical protein [Lentzea sp. NPDC060358]|uniref:hypothetical protein n=1 Tax=Lentzea sp. NPDC060358 TaxID=3347103 RepID=UPI0036595C92
MSSELTLVKAGVYVSGVIVVIAGLVGYLAPASDNKWWPFGASALTPVVAAYALVVGALVMAVPTWASVLLAPGGTAVAPRRMPLPVRRTAVREVAAQPTDRDVVGTGQAVPVAEGKNPLGHGTRGEEDGLKRQRIGCETEGSRAPGIGQLCSALPDQPQSGRITVKLRKP